MPIVADYRLEILGIHEFTQWHGQIIAFLLFFGNASPLPRGGFARGEVDLTADAFKTDPSQMGPLDRF